MITWPIREGAAPFDDPFPYPTKIYFSGETDRRLKALTVVKRFCILHDVISLDHLSNATVPFAEIAQRGLGRGAGARNSYRPTRVSLPGIDTTDEYLGILFTQTQIDMTNRAVEIETVAG